ncbi:MAG TPA: hypothetical protein VJK02_01825 [Anaerolineales bacterium]|nr:hypothetical protein [Anaerolineales bacterium]
MGIRIDAMHSSARAEGPSQIGLLLRKLATVFLLALIGGVSLAFVGLANRTILPSVFEWATSAGLGLLSGVTSRRALRGHSLLLRALAAVAAVIVAMIFMGWISGGDVGLLINNRARPQPNWDGLLQISLSGASAFLALHAWNGRRARTPIEPPPVASPDAPSHALREHSPTPAPWPIVRANRIVPGIGTERAVPLRQILERLERRLKGWKDRLPIDWVRNRLPTWDWSWRQLRPPTANRRGRVRLIGVEEHRCPYCLDLVERHDPRGVVTCKVCHTRHHADCWAVAGMCQVPHHHR